MLLRYIKRYPFSLAVIIIVIYLSFFRPPSVKLPLFTGFDKIVHFLMYFGISGCLWLETFLYYRKGGLNTNTRHAIIGAVIFPIVFSGIVELLQEYTTRHRGGEWLDFLANTCGVIVASAIAWFIVRPLIIKHSRLK